jgi:hypothetical protein
LYILWQKGGGGRHGRGRVRVEAGEEGERGGLAWRRAALGRLSEAAAHAHGGDGLPNRGGGRVRATRCRRKREERGSAAAGR